MLIRSVLLMSICAVLGAAPILPIPERVHGDQQKIALGKKLFFDPLLSRDNTIACATCHDLHNGGDDGLQYSYGIQGRMGEVNTPTVYNAVFNFRQLWDGGAKDLKDQVHYPVGNYHEMNSDMKQVVQKLQSQRNYRERFGQCYKNGITVENIEDAMAAFEEVLVTPNSPFDRYLRGDTQAITAREKRGYILFKSKGCILCHNGMNIGGNLYNKFGIYKESNSTHLGRYRVTKNEEDKYVFKVPSLRNIALTAPYMHDGRAKTLHGAVVVMSEYQLGRYMTEEQIEDIVLFLRTLTGTLPDIIREKP